MDFSLAELTSPAGLIAFAQVVAIDVALAGDNAVVVGALAAGLPARPRQRVILFGIGAALVLRIGFALAVTWLLSFQRYGLILAGGLLLLYVAWKMWREIRRGDAHADEVSGLRAPKSVGAAALSVALADVSMSLDNVLAVAGAAREHPTVLIFGLILSVALMGIASNLIARWIERYRSIAYVGLALILMVAAKMIWDGAHAIDMNTIRGLM
ncbi:MAG: YjbE family putative metal transport protein [Sphingomonadaceae bacterium]|nr:YjbE family putative metal transport protein [Sphingomonadaceae bacterium]